MIGLPVEALIVVAVAVGVAVGLVLDVELPWGGQVPLGHALLIAAIVLVEPAGAVIVGALALAMVAPFRLGTSRGRTDLVVVAAGSAASIAVSLVLRALDHDASTDAGVLVEVAAVGAPYLVADALLGRRNVRRVWPLYLTLLCAAALLAVAYRTSPAFGLVALVPLVVTKYSFARFTDIRQTYAQTTQALSLLPEVAGLTPLGHGERTAVYAMALAEELGFDAPTTERIATAARLHHIGYISLHEPEERTGPPDADALRRVSGELLRETGFLKDVAELVESAQADTVGARTMEAAVIRVCSTLDDLAEASTPEPVATTEGPWAGDPFAALLGHHTHGFERTAAIALLRLQNHRPGVVEEARAASRILAVVAAASGSSDHDHGAENAHDCR